MHNITPNNPCKPENTLDFIKQGNQPFEINYIKIDILILLKLLHHLFKTPKILISLSLLNKKLAPESYMKLSLIPK